LEKRTGEEEAGTLGHESYASERLDHHAKLSDTVNASFSRLTVKVT
jgi:hypothetical protein